MIAYKMVHVKKMHNNNVAGSHIQKIVPTK